MFFLINNPRINERQADGLDFECSFLDHKKQDVSYEVFNALKKYVLNENIDETYELPYNINMRFENKIIFHDNTEEPFNLLSSFLYRDCQLIDDNQHCLLNTFFELNLPSTSKEAIVTRFL
jgi:hypothetical protein